MSKEKREWGKGREHLVAFRVTTGVLEFLESRGESAALAAREIVEQEVREIVERRTKKEAPHSKKEGGQ